jgi:hypothetical protein
MIDYWYSAEPYARADGGAIKRTTDFTGYADFFVLTGILLFGTFLFKGVMHPGAETTRETINEIRDMTSQPK